MHQPKTPLLEGSLTLLQQLQPSSQLECQYSQAAQSTNIYANNCADIVLRNTAGTLLRLIGIPTSEGVVTFARATPGLLSI